GVVAVGVGVAPSGVGAAVFEAGVPQPARPSTTAIPAARTAVHPVLRGNIHPPIGPSPIEGSRPAEPRPVGPTGPLSPDRPDRSARTGSLNTDRTAQPGPAGSLSRDR